MKAEDVAKLDQAQARYFAALHALQSGIAAGIALDAAAGKIDTRACDNTGAASPKHLRVGVDASKVEMGALIKMLIDRGLFTHLEYVTAIANAMEEEVERHALALTKRTGAPVVLR